MGEIAIRIAYVIMVIGMIFCFVFTRKRKKNLRNEINDFAFAFVKLSNYISPKPPKAELKVETLKDGHIRPLPLEKQPEAIRAVIKRALSAKSVKMFATLNDAANDVSARASRNRTYKAQFLNPILKLLYMTHTFLTGCEDFNNIDTLEKKADFDSFLMNQTEHRMVLLKRISGEAGDEYRKLNVMYAKEMEEAEREEFEQRHKKRRGGDNKNSSKKTKDKASDENRKEKQKDTAMDNVTDKPENEKPDVKETKNNPENVAEIADEKGEEEVKQPAEEEESLRDKWRGWGCC